MADPDLQLVKAMANGDVHALDALYARYGRSILTYLIGLLNDRELAEEVLQDVMLVVWRQARAREVLAALDGLALEHYQPFHATRADLLRRAGRPEPAAEAYRAALALTTNPAERRFLERRLTTLAPKH